MEQHQDENDAWMAVRGYVYDITDFIKIHPGGRIIMDEVGQECTEVYDQNHKWVNPKKYLKDKIIGKYQE